MLTLLVFLGGALYPPSNHTGFTYRTPRVLHWLMEGHWHWIYTPDYRMNNRACGFEWLTAPLLLFTKSDRLLFLLNFVSFLLLPGLIFSVFTRLGVRTRVAWWWMWLLPTGYNFLLQAGSTANDTFPTVYALAAIDFALRAWESRRASDLWFSVLAAALLTGAKASNLTLLLPWAVVAWPLAGLLLRKPLATAGVVLVAAVVSFLPNAVLNVHYIGDWSGLKLEREGMNMKNPVVGVWGNGLLLLKNFVPPFFPWAGKWNQSALSLMPQAVVRPMVANFENGFHTIGEMPVEDAAGLGFGVSVLAVVAVGAGLGRKPGDGKNGRHGRNGAVPNWVRRLALIAPWGSLLAYGMKSGIVDAARLISPYYALLLPSLLAGAGQGWVVRRRWWRVMVWGGPAFGGAGGHHDSRAALVPGAHAALEVAGPQAWPAAGRACAGRLYGLRGPLGFAGAGPRGASQGPHRCRIPGARRRRGHFAVAAVLLAAGRAYPVGGYAGADPAAAYPIRRGERRTPGNPRRFAGNVDRADARRGAGNVHRHPDGQPWAAPLVCGAVQGLRPN